MRSVVPFLIFLPAGLIPRHTTDTGGLCGSETLGQTSVPTGWNPRHRFADMQMFECRERDTFLSVWRCKIELLYSTSRGWDWQCCWLWHHIYPRFVQDSSSISREEGFLLVTVKTDLLHIYCTWSTDLSCKESAISDKNVTVFFQAKMKAVIITVLLTQYRGGEL